MYKDISRSIEDLLKRDVKAKALYTDIIYRSRNKELKDLQTLHPFITYVVEKIRNIYGDVDPKEIKKAIIYFYSKNVIGIDADLWK
ncbi:MAG: hypothetical protein ACK4F9_02825 [Brevinematia bacterium]